MRAFLFLGALIILLIETEQKRNLFSSKALKPVDIKYDWSIMRYITQVLEGNF